MRLLNVYTLQFDTFLRKNERPKYVVASHRWNEKHETSLKDITRRRNTGTLGYQKVQKFAEYVKENFPMIEWLWIDTCCINQESSQEVSEAINSMFRWYAESELCLAYLQDVPASQRVDSFERSTWFTRGWTLQELLAPSVVIFLDQDWHTIGYKGSSCDAVAALPAQGSSLLNSHIAAITKIPEEVLYDYSQSHHFSVDDKIKWIKLRQTTREEDISYCMLGVLGVNMSIRYGEGKAVTWRRLLRKARYTTPRDSHENLQYSSQVPQQPDFSVLEHFDVVAPSQAGLSPLSTELADQSHRVHMLCKLCPEMPVVVLGTIASELDAFAHAVYLLEKSDQSNPHNQVDSATLKRCLSIFNGACQRSRSAIDRMEAISNGCSNEKPIDQEKMIQLCNEMNGAKTSLALAYQLYTDARRQKDSTLVLELLTNSSLTPPYRDHSNSRTQRSVLNTSSCSTSSTSSTHPCESIRTVNTHADRRNTFEAGQSLTVTKWRRERRHQSQSRWQLRFTPWFSNRVWEFSFDIVANPQTWRPVPYNALIFEACEEGNLELVQRLFSEGKASPLDYGESPLTFMSDDRTLLSVAAKSQNVQLCRYLIDLVGFPARPQRASNPLKEFVIYRNCIPRKSSLRADPSEMYRLFLDDPNTKVDFKDWANGASMGFWCDCPDLSCWELLCQKSPTAVESLTFSEQLHLAWAIDAHHPIYSDIFLRSFGVRRIDARLATSQNRSCKTILHVIAEHFCRFWFYEGSIAAICSDMIAQIIHYGGNIHHRDKHGRSPLMVLLQLIWIRHSTSWLRSWAGVIAKAGIDLIRYGKVETEIFEELYPSGLAKDGGCIQRFTFGPNVLDWQCVRQSKFEIAVYELDRPPGSWHYYSPYAITRIFWKPASEDYEESWKWKVTRTIEIDIHDGHDDDEDSDPGDPIDSWDGSGQTGDQKDAQDDCRWVTSLITRSARRCSSRRSCSMPSRPKHRIVNILPSTPTWMTLVHDCPYDNTFRLDYGVPDRRCCRGLHSYDVEEIWNGDSGISLRLRNFRERHDHLPSLQSLPYKAYH